MKTEKITCAGYIRVSSVGQTEGESLSIQENAVKEYAKSKGWQIFKIYSDDETGIFSDRSAFQEMKQDATKGKFLKLVFTKLDRLGRSARNNLNLFDYYEKLGIDLVCLDQNISATPEGQLLRGVLSLLAEYEHNLIKMRTQGGRVAKVKRKEHIIGTLPFGFRWNTETLKIESVEEETETCQKIFKYALDGISTGEIARKLNEEGLKTKNDLNWDNDAILLLLRNTAYYGDYITHKFRHKWIEVEVEEDGKKQLKKKLLKEPRPESE